MSQNILITGAAGYMGGTCLAEFISRTSGPIKAANISGAVRSNEQVQSLSKLGVNVIQVDLSNETAVHEAVLRKQIDIIVHTTSSWDSQVASHLIKALGQRRKVSGKEAYFIQSSVTTLFAAEAGWPEHGEVRDTDALFEKQKQMEAPHPIRITNLFVTEEAKAQGVMSLIVPIPYVYGRGTGEWKKLSTPLPAFIRASIKHKTVYKFDKEGHMPAVHVSDLAALYALLIEKILQKEPIPVDEKGYYFAFAHRAPLWDVMQRIANALYSRGIVAEPKVQVWPSDDMAAEYLGFPRPFVRDMGTASGNMIAVNAYKLGWQPSWNQQKFLESIDDEVQAVQELDTIKPSLFDSLLKSS